MENTIIVSPHSGEFKLTYDKNLKFIIPNEISNDYEIALLKWEKIVKFNSIRAKPFKYIMENGYTYILAGPLSYVETRALQECLQDKKNCHLIGIEKEISSISLTVSVISDEGLMLTVLRSPKVSKYPELWSVGLGEGLEDSDFENGHMKEAVKRSLHEELGIQYPQSFSDNRIQFVATAFNTENASLNILAIANFKGAGAKYSSESILHGSQHAPDAWEHINMKFIEPTFDNFITIAQNKFVPGSERYLEIIVNSI